MYELQNKFAESLDNYFRWHMRTVTNIRAKCNDTIKIATVGNIHIEIQVDVVKSSVVEGPRTARLLERGERDGTCKVLRSRCNLFTSMWNCKSDHFFYFESRFARVLVFGLSIQTGYQTGHFKLSQKCHQL